MSLGLLAGIEALGSAAPLWLGGALRGAFARAGAGVGEGAGVDLSVLGRVATAALLGLACVAVAAWLLRPSGRRGSPRELGVREDAEQIAPALAGPIAVAALLALAWTLAAAPAAAARSVDATAFALSTVWLGWARRLLLSLAGLATVAGILERLASARRLWQALHLSPEQAREQARRDGLRR